MGNFEKLGQPLEDDNVEITLDIGCSVSTSGALIRFDFGRDAFIGSGGDGEDLDNFLCWVDNKKSMLELLLPAAFNSVFDDFIEDNDLSSKPTLLLLFGLLFIPPNGDNEAGLLSVSFSESEGKSYNENLASRSVCTFLNGCFGDNAFIFDLENDFLTSFASLFSCFASNLSFKAGSDLLSSNLACKSTVVFPLSSFWLSTSRSCFSCCG